MSDGHFWFEEPGMPIWQQMAYIAGLIEMRHWPYGCPAPTRVSRVLRWVSRQLHWLTWLADGEVRCPFCGCWYMRLEMECMKWGCAACGERWRWIDCHRDVCRPWRPGTFSECWVDAKSRRGTPLGWLEWHYARVVGRLRSWWWRVEEVWQRLTVGYAYVEVWNLNDYLAAYALPRLRHLREHGMAGHSEMSSDEWGRTLDEMIRSLDIYVRDNFPNRGELTEEEQAEVFDPGSRYRRGLRLFGDHWEALWD